VSNSDEEVRMTVDAIGLGNSEGRTRAVVAFVRRYA
jgi:hypothetical protein